MRALQPVGDAVPEAAQIPATGDLAGYAHHFSGGFGRWPVQALAGTASGRCGDALLRPDETRAVLAQAKGADIRRVQDLLWLGHRLVSDADGIFPGVTHIESTPLAEDVAESTTTRNSQQGAALNMRVDPKGGCRRIGPVDRLTRRQQQPWQPHRAGPAVPQTRDTHGAARTTSP